jgi:hypothetical protein
MKRRVRVTGYGLEYSNFDASIDFWVLECMYLNLEGYSPLYLSQHCLGEF